MESNKPNKPFFHDIKTNHLLQARIVYVALCLGIATAGIAKGISGLALISLASLGAVAAKHWWTQTLFVFGLGMATFSVIVLLFAAQGISINAIVLAVAFAIMTVLVWYIRKHLADPTNRAARYLSYLFVVLILCVTAVGVTSFFGPAWSTSSSATNAITCGSLLNQREFNSPWPGEQMNQLQKDCNMLLRQRIGVGAYYASAFALLVFLLVNTRRHVTEHTTTRLGRLRFGKTAIAACSTFVIAVAVLSTLWTNSSLSYAKKHNDSFAPWLSTHQAAFAKLQVANDRLYTAQKQNDAVALIAACDEAKAVANALEGSDKDWPSRYEKRRAQWTQFVNDYKQDAETCATRAKSDTAHTTGAFAKSSASMESARPNFAFR